MKNAILSLPLLLSLHVGAASFDCTRASTATEKAICASTATGQLDERLADTYRAALSVLPETREELKKEQLSWLRSRDALCGGDNRCLDRSYHERIRLLEERIANRLRQNPPCTSLYAYPHIIRIVRNVDWDTRLDQHRLMLHDLGEDRAALYLSSTGTNAHACTFEGIARKEGDKWTWETSYRDVTSQEDEPCRLEFTRHDGGYISVSVGEEQSPGDIEMTCQRYYCGVRAHVPSSNAFIPAERLLAPGECNELQQSFGEG